MSVQETFTSATSNLWGVKAAVLVVIVAVAALALGAEQALRVADIGVPWRQLMTGRTLPTLTLSFRVFTSLAWAHVAARRRR